MLLACIWQLVVWMKCEVVNDLHQDTYPEDCNDSNDNWQKIQTRSRWPVKVPDSDHSSILTIHNWIIYHISNACTTFDQVEKVKNANKCGNGIKEVFLYLCGAECRTLCENPDKHDHPVNTTEQKQTVLCARREHSKRQYSWSYYE